VNFALSVPGFVGHWVLRAVRTAGLLSLLFGRILRELPRMKRSEYLRLLQGYGIDSLPLASQVGLLVGALVILQTSLYAHRFGARAVMGWAAGYAAIWEFGPLLLGLMMNARVGARNAAELASLRMGGQIEGLSGVSVDPLAVLIAPRVWGIATAVSLISLPGLFLACISEVITAKLILDLPPRVFLASFAGMLGLPVLMAGLLKSFANGWAVALISTSLGLRARGGSRAVGQAAAETCVWGAFAIFAIDFALTWILTATGSAS
jgi:phospholipid/cholesterol/gamma-HCH transport system permease protein